MISLLVVNYRSAALAVAAIESARASTSQPLQVVAVDNSCDESEAAKLRPHCDILVVSPVNRGYAGAINDGRRQCRGDVLVVSNPDVKYGAGSIDLLAQTLNGRTTVAGPALFWDDAFEWVLPPSDLHTGVERIDEILASRSAAWRRVRDTRRIRRRIAFWSATAPTSVRAISGAVMAIRAEAFDRAEGFDERFALYFEEDDFLRRIAAFRDKIVYVPSAKCQHLYNQSASQVLETSAAAYASSEAKYLAKWNGPLAARVLKKLQRPPLQRPAQPLDGPLDVPADHFVEVSPDSSFETCAGHFPIADESLDFPAAAWESFRGDKLYLRLVHRKTAQVRTTFVRYKS
jgi:N-acetylglucosaminyl-diphospho-decaprenol L-rhamnosyltransferase